MKSLPGATTPGVAGGRKCCALVAIDVGLIELGVRDFGEPSERSLWSVQRGVVWIPSRIMVIRTADPLTVRLITEGSSVQIGLGPIPELVTPLGSPRVERAQSVGSDPPNPAWELWRGGTSGFTAGGLI